MSFDESTLGKTQLHFEALAELASSLNKASDELTKVVGILDEALKKLNVGLTVWVDFDGRGEDEEPWLFDDDQIGYCKVNGKWGIAVQRVWGDQQRGEYASDGPWLFNDAPREMRLKSVDKIPAVIEKLGKEAFETTKRVQQKTEQVRALASAIGQVANAGKTQSPSPATTAPSSRIPFGPPRSAKKMRLRDLMAVPKEGGK
jgi:hypothetical protein